jgi:hypothetical protein
VLVHVRTGYKTLSVQEKMVGTTTPLVTVLTRLDESAAAGLRQEIRALVRDAGVEDVAPSVALLTTELVAGAFERGAQALIVYVECDARHVRVEVADAFRAEMDGPSFAVPEATPLRRRLLDAFSDGWGSVISDDAELVWFDLGIRSPAR